MRTELVVGPPFNIPLFQYSNRSSFRISILRISDFDLGLLGLPSTEFILSVAEGLRTGLARSKERKTTNATPSCALFPSLLVSWSPGLLFSCLLVWFFLLLLSPSPSRTRPSIDPPRLHPPYWTKVQYTRTTASVYCQLHSYRRVPEVMWRDVS